MSEFLYRVDRLEHLRNVQDKFYRARLWRNASDYPHKALMVAQRSVPQGHGIFRVCFWPSLERAKKSLEADYSYWGDGVITRVLLDDVQSLEFTETWDDGFDEGEAYLFWKYDAALPNNPTLSNSGISTSHIQAYKDGGWMSFEAVAFPDREEACATGSAESVGIRQAATLGSSQNRTTNSFWQRLRRRFSANG